MAPVQCETSSLFDRRLYCCQPETSSRCMLYNRALARTFSVRRQRFYRVALRPTALLPSPRCCGVSLDSGAGYKMSLFTYLFTSVDACIQGRRHHYVASVLRVYFALKQNFISTTYRPPIGPRYRPVLVGCYCI